MATFHKGNMWQRWGKVDLFCITTNATVKSNGALVMGRGIAKEMRDKFPGIDKKLAGLITMYQDGNFRYGLVIAAMPDTFKIGAFQVKYSWNEKANLDLICYSTTELFRFIVYFQPHTVCLNFPGIGNGGLPRDVVLPIISLLPDCVEIWEKE